MANSWAQEEVSAFQQKQFEQKQFVPPQKVQGPEFKPQYCQKVKQQSEVTRLRTQGQ
jgi:hypothetical protein